MKIDKMNGTSTTKKRNHLSLMRIKVKKFGALQRNGIVHKPQRYCQLLVKLQQAAMSHRESEEYLCHQIL